MEKNDEFSLNSFEEYVSKVLKNLPEEYSNARDQAEVLTKQFQSALAIEMQKRLNEYAKLQPQETLIQKRELASKINNDLRSIGLAIRNPKTGINGSLVADTAISEGVTPSRFRLESTVDGGKRVKSAVMAQLGDLELMPATTRREPNKRER